MLHPRVLNVFGVMIMLLSVSAPLLQLAAQTKPRCTSPCGRLEIPYPFGTIDRGSHCYYDAEPSLSFVIFCDNSTDPPVPYWGSKSSNIPIVDISVDNHEMRVMMFVAHDCYNSSGDNIRSNSPSAGLANFKLSSTKNRKSYKEFFGRFTVVGCDSYAYFMGQQNNIFSTGCMSLCNTITDVNSGSCSGIGCCQASLPRNMKAFDISLGSYYNHTTVYDFNPCSFAFVAENDYFNFSIASLKNITEEKMPTVLDWSVGKNQTCEVARKNMASYMCKENTNCTDVDPDNGEVTRGILTSPGQKAAMKFTRVRA
ncbi:hypothetical protein CRG98_029046 [Punica granatum]|uniref:Uncharacterized protein n=1 Tax=Punica granatum TaxID=22663 RepID=A0A2I0J3M9_PUNGR|nr:hypothetical protein CRG98_029046 [Punica granatum]